MLKRNLIAGICLGLVIIITSCDSTKNVTVVGNKNIQHTSQKNKSDETKNFAVPGFERIYNNIIEIDINFNSNGMYNGIKPIQIRDSKILSDILSMLGKSELITDESKIQNMSGMVEKNNKLIFVTQNGNKKEITFAFDDPAFEVGYVDIDGKKYNPGFSFFRYLRDFTEYKQFDTNIDNQAVELFKEHEWTVDYRINTFKEVLPANLKHEAGEYPVKIYWAYNNELSKSIGLDYSDYIGKSVDVDIYRLREPLPDYMKPRMDARGIILKYDGKIIGAYIDAGRHDCFACSLDRKSLKDITSKDWDNWIGDYIDYNNKLETKLSKMDAEDIIKQYYDAMNRHDEKTQFACMTRQNICNYLAMNMDNNRLFNEGFKNAYVDGEQNVKSAELIKVREIKVMDNPEGTVEYEATVDFKFKKVITSDSGIQPRFIILKKESEKSGWRIQSEGTGP
jgi:hypothetical protein